MSGTTEKYWLRILASSAVYAAAGWAAVEALLTVIERFGLPAWLEPLLVALYVAGLPVTVYLVWRTAGVERRLNLASFVGAMSFLVVATVAIFWLTRTPLPTEETTIAVLPCTIDNEDNNVYRADGFAEDIHARLSRVDAVRIISWNSSLFVRDKNYSPQKIAELLRVNRLVRCRMNTNGDRLAVSAQLIDPTVDRVLWNRDYDFVASDLGTVVTELAGTLLNVLSTPVEAAELDQLNDIGTFSPEAFDLFLQARGASAVSFAQQDKDEYDSAESLVTRALEIDPNYAEAMVFHAGLYLDRAVAQEFDDMDEPLAWLREARSLAQRALELNPGIWDARQQLARVCSLLGGYFGEDCPDGEIDRLWLEECEVRGDTAEGWACRHRMSDSEEDSKIALGHWLELEPTTIDGNMQYMALLHGEGADLADVLTVFETLRALEPDDRRPYGMLSNMLRRDGMLDEVLAWRYGTNEDQLPENPWWLARLGTDYMNLGLYAPAKKVGLLTWEIRRASAMHFLPILWARSDEKEQAAAATEWLAETIATASGSNEQWLDAASFYASELRDYERARELYNSVMGTDDLGDVCEGDNECVLARSLQLEQIEKTLGHDDEAAAWLLVAEKTIGQMPDDEFSAAVGPSLRAAQGRHEEAVQMLRDGILGWRILRGQDLMFPIYFVEGNSMLDPLRDMPEFQQLLDEYHALLEPMRQRVMEAEHSGNWEALRQRTFQRARGQAD